MKKNVLAIEDEQNWLDNYKAWLSEEFDLDYANLTTIGERLLQEKRYYVVILDLAMSIHDQSERQNRAIQSYLSTHPEGTLCIVVSAVANQDDTQDAWKGYNAMTLLKKPEIDPEVLLATVQQAYNESKQSNNNLKAESKNFLFGNVIGDERLVLEGKFSNCLKSKNTTSGLSSIIDILLEEIYPIALHKKSERSSLAMNEAGCVLGLFWSRQLGHPVSIVLSKKDLLETDATARLDEWLGWAHGSETIYQKEISNVRVQCFKEELSSDGFALPKIS